MRATITSRSPRMMTLALVIVATTGMSSCSKSSPTCDALSTLQSSVQALRDVNVADDGVPALQSAMTTVQTNLDALKSAADTQAGAQLTAMVAATTATVAAVQQAVDSPDTTTIAAAGVAVAATVAAADALQAALPDCK